MKKVNLASFGDILHHATSMGYNWNQAHDILVKDGVPPMYECSTRDYYLEELDECLSGESLEIVKSFMKDNNVDHFTLTRD